MAYHGGGGPTPLHNGYWPGDDPPNPNAYNNNPLSQVQHPITPSAPNGNQGGSLQYQPPTSSSAHSSQGHYWNQSLLPQYSQEQLFPQPAGNGHHIPSLIPTPTQLPPPAPTRSQPAPFPPTQTPQFVSPAQLFQQPAQPQPLPQYLSPQQIFQHRSITSNTSARMAPIQTASVQIDQPKLLMSLAEEFFDAAHALAPSIALSMTPANINAYEKLIALGLGCLETALKNLRLTPRAEAIIRLRFAGVLFEETENFMEAETALSKGITLCDRNHYYDIKYAMQFLLSQFMFKKSPKAAIKALESHISDATVYQHYSWVYALRFLRASYSVESGNATDTHAAIQNLREIAKLSSQQGDRAVYLTVSLMETMVHLKSNGLESIEQAQRSLAAAWKYQLDTGAQISQLTGLAHILDVVCSIRQGNFGAMVNKLKEMQAIMDGFLKDLTWSTTDDTIAVPINGRNSSQVVSPDTRMIIGIGADGRDNIMMPFLGVKDAFSITYLLAGMVLMHRNSENQNAFKYLESGLANLEKNIIASRASSDCLPDCISKIQWRGQILCYYHIYLAFCAAEVSNWAAMMNHVDKLRDTAKDLNVPLAGPLEIFALYLAGVYQQGIGDLDAALRIFQDAKFDLSTFQSSNLSAANQFMRDASLLAALNTIWILQQADRQDLHVNTSLIMTLEDICETHPNKDIQTAYNLVVATVNVNPPAPLIKIKKYLGNALAGAKATGNTQFICFTLSIMCGKFFINVVGEQAEKSAMAASMQAKKSGNILWQSVAEGMLSQCYDVNGKKEKASNTFKQALALAQRALPEL